MVKVVSRTKSIPDHEERGIEEIHVKGGRSGEIAYMMDGMYLRNPIFGSIGSGTRLNLFAVRQFDWQPGGFNAEYGDAQSAVSNWHTAAGASEIAYHFRYETSNVGAGSNSALGNDLETNNYDLNRGYNDYNFGVVYDFVVFLRSGDSVTCTASNRSNFLGFYRQLADISGTLVNPTGYTGS